MGKSLLVLLFSITLISAYSQEKATTSSSTFEGAKSAFFVELLGNGILFSANYDTRLINNFGARVGIGYLAAPVVSGGDFLTIPVMGNFLFGKNGNYFEMGAGFSYVTTAYDIFDNDSFSNIVGTLSFMYRKQPVNGGFMWKIGLTPFFNFKGYLPFYGGVSLGYCW